MFRRLKARAADVKTISGLLLQAEEIARSGGTDKPAAEHLVLAALHLPDGTASRTLARVGLSGEDLRGALEDQEVGDLERIGIQAPDDQIRAELPELTAPTGVYQSEPSAQQLFRAAGDDARRNGEPLVGAHVLRAAAASEHGTTARVLRRLGIEPGALERAATAEIQAHHGADH